MLRKKNVKERSSGSDISIKETAAVKSNQVIPSANEDKKETVGKESGRTFPRKQTILESHGYELGRTIGNGSYATVKLAYSEKHQANVAIKIVSKYQAPTDYLKKFLPREIDVVKGLKHVNLIRFMQAIETTHRVYIIMEYAENGSLLDIIRRDTYIDEYRAKKWFKQLADAVSYCHSNNVVHRDIKCENLLMDSKYYIKLSDFGFARIESERKGVLSETFCGSYAYASPEILRGIPYKPMLSDIWSMGVVLFAMVYGRLPFDDANYSILLKQVQSKVQFPREPHVSTTCRALIHRILAPARLRLHMPEILNDVWLKEETRKASSGSSKEKLQSGGEAISSDSDAAPITLITKDALKAAASSKKRRKVRMEDNAEKDDVGRTTEEEKGLAEIKGRDTDTDESNQKKK